MWIDLASEVSDAFEAYRIEDCALPSEPRFFDPHRDADQWLSATTDARNELAPVYADKLARFRKEHARRLVVLTVRRETRTPAQLAAKTRAYLAIKRTDPMWCKKEVARVRSRRAKARLAKKA